jgi:hypothetical protein
VYQLYAEGIVFGGCMPIAVIVALIVGGRAFRRWHRIAPRHPMLMPLSMALLVLAALPGASIGGNPLGTRFSGLVYGLALGLIVALYSQLHYRIDLQRKRQRLHPAYGREPAFRPTAPAAAPVPLNTYATPEPR